MIIEERIYRLDELKRNPIVNLGVDFEISDEIIAMLSEESSGELLLMVSDNKEKLENEIEIRYGEHKCWGPYTISNTHVLLYIIDRQNYGLGEYELTPSGQSKDDEKDNSNIEFEM